VKVEYYDPSGVFSLIQPELIKHLPLRNLYWKSPTRPLRNIDALYIEFIPDSSSYEVSNAGLRRSSSNHVPRRNSGDIWPTGRRASTSRSVVNPVKGDVNPKERRHQIPGLRETPFLKLFIVRSDDKESYKTLHRARLREWAKPMLQNANPSVTGHKHGNHDASEWMIIHVVIPGSQAASEPRWTAAKNDPDELAERATNKTKWPGKGNSTVFDKMRADFPAGKSGLERVAQIRIPKEAIPPQFLPKVFLPGNLVETPTEQENAWQDVVSKFSTLILQSFETRVNQYEDDIREREIQRSLPGWNFCTYFTMKEGLARGFESVGLVEDALSIYDNLEVDLEITFGDHSAYLGDLKSVRHTLVQITNNVDHQSFDTAGIAQMTRILGSLLDSDSDLYRDLIVSSTISLFDFHAYIFSRQRLLLYRLGQFEPRHNAQKLQAQNKTNTESQLLHLAEVCKRTSTFVAANARLLRKEVDLSSDECDKGRYDRIVQSFTSCWAFSILERILIETAVSLTVPIAQSNSYPLEKNKSSFAVRRSSIVDPAVGTTSDTSLYKPTTIGSGFSDLAASRGELCMLQRRFLEILAVNKGWTTGWLASSHDKPLVDDGSPNKENIIDLSAILKGSLVEALSSATMFANAYQDLTDTSIRHLVLGDRQTAVDTLMGDSAFLKYQSGDYTGAAQILQRLVPKYLMRQWSSIESEMLQIYGQCLKKLNRKDEYVRITLALIKKSALSKIDDQEETVNALQQDWSARFVDLVECSKGLHLPYKATNDDILLDVVVSPQINHSGNKSGFNVDVEISLSLDLKITCDLIELKLVSTRDASLTVLLCARGPLMIQNGIYHVPLSSNVMVWGLFTIQSVVLHFAQLQFVKTFAAKSQESHLILAEKSVTKSYKSSLGPLLMVFPHAEALDISIRSSSAVHIDQQRSIDLHIKCGSFKSDIYQLRVKPATAALRLFPGSAKIVGSDKSELSTDKQNKMTISLVDSESFIIKLPYTIDNATSEIVIRLEITYTIDEVQYTALFEEDIIIDLAVDVDIVETYKAKGLFARFNAMSTSDIPFISHSLSLSADERYIIDVLPCSVDVPVYDKQPASLTCRINPRKSVTAPSNVVGEGRKLELTAVYSCLFEVVLKSIEDCFDTALAKSELIVYKRLLRPILKRLLVRHLTGSFLEEVILARHVSIPDSILLGWDSYLAILPEDTHSILRGWLHQWHTDNSKIPIDIKFTSLDMRRSLIVPVTLTPIDILATTSFSFSLPNSLSNGLEEMSSHLPQIARLGQPLNVQLKICITTKFSSRDLQKKVFRLKYTILPCISSDNQKTKHKKTTSTGLVDDDDDLENDTDDDYETNVDYKLDALRIQTFTPSVSNRKTKRQERKGLAPLRQEWIIAGPTTNRFTLSSQDQDGQSNAAVFDLILIPCRKGIINLPDVQVSLSDPHDDPEGEPEGLICETEHVSKVTSLLVIDSSPRSTTLSRSKSMTSEKDHQGSIYSTPVNATPGEHARDTSSLQTDDRMKKTTDVVILDANVTEGDYSSTGIKGGKEYYNRMSIDSTNTVNMSRRGTSVGRNWRRSIHV